jgi:hypothetical protein
LAPPEALAREFIATWQIRPDRVARGLRRAMLDELSTDVVLRHRPWHALSMLELVKCVVL